MNWLDIVLVVLVVVGIVKGYKDGFIRQIVFFIALIAAIYLCSRVAVNIREYMIQTGWFDTSTVTLLSYILAFIMIAGIITLAGWIMHKMIDVTPLSLFNHFAGAALGLVGTMLILSLALNIMAVVDRGSALIPQDAKTESRFYYYIKDIIPGFYMLDFFISHKNGTEGLVV